MAKQTSNVTKIENNSDPIVKLPLSTRALTGDQKQTIVGELIDAKAAGEGFEEFANRVFGLAINGKTDPSVKRVNQALASAWRAFRVQLEADEDEETLMAISANPPALKSRFGAAASAGREAKRISPDGSQLLRAKLNAKLLGKG
jgi:hypothetical protein